MVSFSSTLPSLVSLIPSPSSIANASRYPPQAGMICCKFGPELNNEDRCFRRRDVLHSFGAAVGMDLIARSSSFVEVANAADLIQRRQRSEFQSKIKGILYEAIKGNPDIVPSILTLALNDIMTYDKATKSGGPNGSIRFSSEISRPENKGLAAAMNLLEESKKEIDSDSKGGPISYADLIQLAAQSAVKSTFLASAIRKCGGNVEKGSLLYSAYGSNGQWGLFDRQFGRSDAQEPDPEGRVPQWDKASVQEMKDKFKAVGFGPRQLAVMSAFIGPDQDATEALLANDPEVLPWVQKYQRSRETVSRTDYEVDLITTLTKLSCLGQQINYEAYSYPVQKIDVTKLKL
ncbi:thylakoid lumenal 29 kDa protein, chloroplastic isoform X2 [Nicotiana tabacum]|uniref:Thylakoid lumenal 29 kDa protein, chloroplastic n=1 Tax=Nicotiana tabacum TaxID=4097 RepID=A0A1S4A9E7_TOBAC|nr:thylakoid lumenal 29 kDa protein, chloroplastic [Nicotiana tomentosiformis]XP_016473265.1 PREDICTED: thylakoid lumenal 29 kDa protein, chloroplastic [Nicotiana tabacum]